MLHILQVTGLMNRGGAEVMLMDILRHKPNDVHFDFLINNQPDNLERTGVFDDEIRASGCRMRYIGTQLRIGPQQYIKQFKKVCDELRPDVVHIHLNAKCGIIALAARRAGVKHVIAHCHANIKFHGSWLSNFVNNTEVFLQKFLISHYATNYWGCSPEANRRLYWPWVRKQSVVINNAIDTDAYADVNQEEARALKSSYQLPTDCLVLGNVGRIVPHKNLAFIIDIIAALREMGRDAALVVAGRNDTPQYVDVMMARAKEAGVDNRIIFLGERSDIPVVMRSFDLFVGTSLQEGFGLVAVEAQAARVPCVLYKGFPATVDMGMGLCRFHNDFDANQWAASIVDMAGKGSTLKREEIVQAIRAKGFDAKSNAANIAKMYHEIAENQM